MGKIIVAGSINMDVVAGVTKHPVPGETIFGRDLQFIPGGKGANQAVAAARLNGDVHLIGKVGKDAFGGQLLDFLRSEAMNTDFVTQNDNASGTALILVDDNSENTIVVISGSNMDVSPHDVAEIVIESHDIALATFEVPQETTLALFERTKTAGGMTIMNAAPATEFIVGLQEQVDIVIVNETELAFFAGDDVTISDDLDILEKQAQTFRCRDDQIIVMTLGAKGVL
ncbi:MAG: ribokinase, partial [Aggregatilineales bacterium]